MPLKTQNTDAKGRLSLPKSFANATVVIEQISDSELRIRKAPVTPKEDPAFREESSSPLSNRDRDRFLKLLANPPRANKALRRAAAEHQDGHG